MRPHWPLLSGIGASKLSARNESCCGWVLHLCMRSSGAWDCPFRCTLGRGEHTRPPTDSKSIQKLPSSGLCRGSECFEGPCWMETIISRPNCNKYLRRNHIEKVGLFFHNKYIFNYFYSIYNNCMTLVENIKLFLIHQIMELLNSSSGSRREMPDYV